MLDLAVPGPVLVQGVHDAGLLKDISPLPMLHDCLLSTVFVSCSDCKASAVAKMEWNLRQVLGSDTATISTLRCLKLYLERLGANFLDTKSVQEVAGSACALVEDAMVDVTFLNCRPSVVAAAILYAERRSRYWKFTLV